METEVIKTITGILPCWLMNEERPWGCPLPGHKNLARTYGVVTFDGITYRIRDRMEEPESEETVVGVLQEYVSGKDLLKVLGANPQGLSPEKVVCLWRGITQGLVAMHDAGFYIET